MATPAHRTERRGPGFWLILALAALLALFGIPILVGGV